MKRINLFSAVILGALLVAPTLSLAVDDESNTVDTFNSQGTITIKGQDKNTETETNPGDDGTKTDHKGDLRLDSVPNFHFGVHNKGGGIINAAHIGKGNNVQLTDLRSNLAGWTLNVSATPFTIEEAKKSDSPQKELGGTTITFVKDKNEKYASDETGKLTLLNLAVLSEADKTLQGDIAEPVKLGTNGEKATLMNAKNGSGSGVWRQTYKGVDKKAADVKTVEDSDVLTSTEKPEYTYLTFDSTKADKGLYTSTLTWTLSTSDTDTMKAVDKTKE